MKLIKKDEKLTKDYWNCPICGVVFMIEHKKEHIIVEVKEINKDLKCLNGETCD